MQDFLASELPVKYHDGCTQEVLFFMLSCAESKDAAMEIGRAGGFVFAMCWC